LIPKIKRNFVVGILLQLKKNKHFIQLKFSLFYFSRNLLLLKRANKILNIIVDNLKKDNTIAVVRLNQIDIAIASQPIW
jgi:hypothetical protein